MEIKLSDVNDAVKGVNDAFDEYKKTNDEQIALLAKTGDIDALLETKLEQINIDMAAYQKTIDEFQLAQKRQARFVTDSNGQEIDLDAKAQHWVNGIAKKRGMVAPANFDNEALSQYKASFNKLIRYGEQAMTQDELKNLSVGSDPDGGFFVHPDMSGRVIEQVFETSIMRQYASIQTIGTDTLKGVYDDDEADAAWEGETQVPTESDTPEIGEWSIPVSELRSLNKATQKLLEDSEVNVESWLEGKVSAKMSRKENTAFCTGNGVGMPRGFLTYDDGTTLRTAIEQFDTGVNGAFAAAPDGGDTLIDALYGLKAEYRANAIWFMNRATTALTRKLKDSDGAYLWQPSLAAGQPATLLGYGVAAFEDMPDPATGSLSIAVGDMKQAYQIVDRLGISVLRDPYSYKPYVGFYSRKRAGGAVLNTEALKIVAFKA